jgi:DcuC family C4-dicarboxylate transporter
MTLLLGSLIIAAAVYAVVKRVDVRLALLLAAAMLGILGGQPEAIVRKFFSTLTSPSYVIPLCSAMGFAYVLRHTLCDQHLVHALARPLRKARAFLIPGAVLVGFLVNIPVISQTSSAVAIGSVVIPLLLMARISPVTAGSALLLGASVGGELLNPGAPEYRTIARGIGAAGGVAPASTALVQHSLPLVLLQLAVALGVFWAISLRAEAEHAKERERAEEIETHQPQLPHFKVSPFKAMVPGLPLVLLFLVAPPLELFKVPPTWLVTAKEAADPVSSTFDSRLIGAAMLVGVAAAALTDRRAVSGVMGAFFEGAGFALGHIVSIIVAAACFGEGVKLIGFDKVVGQAVSAWPHGLIPTAGFLPLAFGAISGSGIAATEGVYSFFTAPAMSLGIPPDHVGSVVSLGAAAGRTMSPVAAVTLMSASLTETSPAELVKRVAPPLLVGMVVVVLVASLTTPKEAPHPAPQGLIEERAGGPEILQDELKALRAVVGADLHGVTRVDLGGRRALFGALPGAPE